MTKKQIWQTIALDLKRGANYIAAGSIKKADYYLNEAKSLFESQQLEGDLKKIEQYIRFEGNPEDILLSGSLISTRIQV
ncbi:MAG: hypothetical protein WC799_24750 [Desulfobacteraceae bacterium]|jgi:hypothetical protein